MWEMQKVEVNGEKEAVCGGGTFASAPLSSDLTAPCPTIFTCFDTQVNQEGVSMRSRNPTGEVLGRDLPVRSGAGA